MPDVKSNDEVNNQEIFQGILGAAAIGLGMYAGVKGAGKIKNTMKNAKLNAKPKFNKSTVGKTYNKVKRGTKKAVPGDDAFIGPMKATSEQVWESRWNSYFDNMKNSKHNYDAPGREAAERWSAHTGIDKDEFIPTAKPKPKIKDNYENEWSLMYDKNGNYRYDIAEPNSRFRRKKEKNKKSKK